MRVWLSQFRERSPEKQNFLNLPLMHAWDAFRRYFFYHDILQYKIGIKINLFENHRWILARLSTNELCNRLRTPVKPFTLVKQVMFLLLSLFCNLKTRGVRLSAYHNTVGAIFLTVSGQFLCLFDFERSTWKKGGKLWKKNLFFSFFFGTL